MARWVKGNPIPVAEPIAELIPDTNSTLNQIYDLDKQLEEYYIKLDKYKYNGI